jgi:Tfp pilus assembly major pilin PilA
MTTEHHVTPPSPAVKRRSSRWVWWLIGIVVVLAVILVVADIAVRSYAENRAAAEISDQLPASVEGDVDVTIGGFSFLSQLVAGRFDQVQLDAPGLTVDGVPVEAHVTAKGVPTDLAQPVDDIQAALTLDQAAVDAVVTLPGDAELVLGDAGVSYEGSIDLFGVQLGYRVLGEVSASGTDVVIVPRSASLTQGSNDVDIDLGSLLGGVTKDPITVCVAHYLPQGATIESLDVRAGSATVYVTANDFVLSEDSLRDLGTCP